MIKKKLSKPSSNLILTLEEFNKNMDIIKNQPADFQSKIACALIQTAYENLFNKLKKLNPPQ